MENAEAGSEILADDVLNIKNISLAGVLFSFLCAKGNNSVMPV